MSRPTIDQALSARAAAHGADRRSARAETLGSADRCSSCLGVYHPATGHRFGDRVVICGPCTRHFIAWLKGHLKRRWNKLDFYEHAASSVRAP